VKSFLTRYLWIDATYVKLRHNGLIASVAMIIGGRCQQRRPALGAWISVLPRTRPSRPRSCAHTKRKRSSHPSKCAMAEALRVTLPKDPGRSWSIHNRSEAHARSYK
jgi:hypothetical protein